MPRRHIDLVEVLDSLRVEPGRCAGAMAPSLTLRAINAPTLFIFTHFLGADKALRLHHYAVSSANNQQEN